jgi:hypothetical protein
MLHAMITIAVIVVLLVLYLVFDRERYFGRRSDGMRPTAEIFRDPGSGKLMRVHENPKTGEREYRPEP